MDPNHDGRYGCTKCNDFSNKNIEGFIFSKYHKCAKLDFDLSQ